MPPSVVKNKEDERLWDKAKDIAAEAGKKEEYDYVMGIFKKMNPDRFASLSPALKLAHRYLLSEENKTSSLSRYDLRFLATNGKWYLILGNGEHDDYEDSTAYGPFPSKDAVERYADRFSSSGGGDIDDSGTRPPPTMSPNGEKLVSPNDPGYGSMGGGRYYGGGGSRWAAESAKKLAAEFLSKTAVGEGLSDKIRGLAAHFLDRPYVRYNKGTLSFSERGAKPWAGSETYNIPALLASPRVKGMSGDMQDFLKALHKILLPLSGQDVEVPSNIAVAWLDADGFTDQSSFNLDTEYNIDTHYDRRGFYASSDKTAAEPPMHMAAKADEALGEAYNSLVALKLGFDTWEEIPQSTLPLYNWIGKAISQVVTARQSTHQVREMVRQKKY